MEDIMVAVDPFWNPVDDGYGYEIEEEDDELIDEDLEEDDLEEEDYMEDEYIDEDDDYDEFFVRTAYALGELGGYHV